MVTTVRTPMTEPQPQNSNDDSKEPAKIVICGAGIVGLVLALALEKHTGIKAELYEKVSAFHDDVGAGMGMYPNGLRVVKDLDLLQSIREQGYPYMYRRWERHDGTEVMVSEESVLSDRDNELQPVGIRRWRLLKILYDAVTKSGMKVHFGKALSNAVTRKDREGLVDLHFEDGTMRTTEILFGVDGVKSKVRQVVTAEEEGTSTASIKYTGVTCLMGISKSARSERGISFPSSATTKCHGCFFPTGYDEQCFQFHFPTPVEQSNEGNWGTLSEKVGMAECRKLSENLRKDGWDEKYLTPLINPSNAVRIGFCSLEQVLEKLVYGQDGRIVLLGDAAHPPVPYIGQGSQMGLEDAAIIAALLEKLCVDENTKKFSTNNFSHAMKIYEKMRIPRTREVSEKSHFMGNMQQKRALNKKYNKVKEELIQREVFYHETLPVYIPVTNYDFKADVTKVLEEEPVLLSRVAEEQ